MVPVSFLWSTKFLCNLPIKHYGLVSCLMGCILRCVFLPCLKLEHKKKGLLNKSLCLKVSWWPKFLFFIDQLDWNKSVFGFEFFWRRRFKKLHICPLFRCSRELIRLCLQSAILLYLKQNPWLWRYTQKCIHCSVCHTSSNNRLIGLSKLHWLIELVSMLRKMKLWSMPMIPDM